MNSENPKEPKEIFEDENFEGKLNLEINNYLRENPLPEIPVEGNGEGEKIKKKDVVRKMLFADSVTKQILFSPDYGPHSYFEKISTVISADPELDGLIEYLKAWKYFANKGLYYHISSDEIKKILNDLAQAPEHFIFRQNKDGDLDLLENQELHDVFPWIDLESQMAYALENAKWQFKEAKKKLESKRDAEVEGLERRVNRRLECLLERIPNDAKHPDWDVERHKLFYLETSLWNSISVEQPRSPEEMLDNLEFILKLVDNSSVNKRLDTRIERPPFPGETLRENLKYIAALLIKEITQNPNIKDLERKRIENISNHIFEALQYRPKSN